MSTYFNAGDRVVYRSHPNAEPEPGVVLRDTITGFVFVDYGQGRVAATSREDLTLEVSA